jgi:Proteins containing SET domain
MFNHSCRPFENALWGYDKKVPNRVVIWANKDIKAGEEIRIPYQRYRIADAVGEDVELNIHAVQLFGKNCGCPRCQGRGLVPPVDNGKAKSVSGLSLNLPTKFRHPKTSLDVSTQSKHSRNHRHKYGHLNFAFVFQLKPETETN